MRHLPALLLLSCLAGVAAAASAPAPAPAAPQDRGQPSPLADRDGNRIADGLQAALREAPPGALLRVVVVFSGQGSVASARQSVGFFEVHHQFSVINGFSASMTPGQITALARQPGIARIEEDFRVRTQLDAARADFGVDTARASFGLTGAGIKGCIVDTGVDPGHEQLNAAPIPFFDAINQRSVAYDDHGHGTHVASIAFGDGTGGAAAARYGGVAPGVAIHAAKVLDQYGSGLESQVIQGIDWCVAQGVHLISMSLGTSAASDGQDALSRAVDAAASRGIVVVVAAGNAGEEPHTVGSPGAAAQAITVGACAEWSAPAGAPNRSEGVYLAPFSSRGPTLDGRTKPDLCAPGHSIIAAQAGSVDGYATYSGTSMATPFVAGTMALALQTGALTVSQLHQQLEATAQDRGPAGKDNDWGAGLIDAHAFLARAKGLSDVSPTPFPTHGSVSARVANHGLWSHDLSIDAADLDKPIAVMLTIEGQPKCALEYFGICFSMQWDPDLEARLLDPAGRVLAEGTCLADDECGRMGRQETLHAMPTVAGRYTVQVFPAEDSGNQGKGGRFRVDLSSGPLGGSAGTTPPPPAPGVHVSELETRTLTVRNGWKAEVTVRLHDQNHQAVTTAATVTGTWSGGYSGTASCSSSSGACTVSTGNISKRKTSVTFTVTNVSGSSAYAPADNDVDASITILRP